MSAKQVSVIPGMHYVESLMASDTRGSHAYLINRLHASRDDLPAVAFVNVPMYAQWFRRESMAWYTLSELPYITTTFNVDVYQEYYDQVLMANASNGYNRLIKAAYDALYGEGDLKLRDIFGNTQGWEAIYIAVKDYVREGGDIDKWIRMADVADTKAIRNAIVRGATRDMTTSNDRLS